MDLLTQPNNSTSRKIKTFHDLYVYQNLYKAMLIVMKQILPNLPKEEKYDLCDQMRRASKAAPALIAEGFAKRYHKRYWKKYLDDCQGEANEMIHHLSVCKDVYGINVNSQICDETRQLYLISCKQKTKLGQSWQNYQENKKN